MRILERRRHQFRRLIGRKPEHDALVARALLFVSAVVDTHGDISGLFVQTALILGVLPVKAGLFVTDVLDRGAYLFFKRVDHITWSADLAADDDEICRNQRFAGHARVGVLRQEGIDDGIGNTVGYLVGMALRNAFTGE